jgi:hypothetical protein
MQIYSHNLLKSPPNLASKWIILLRHDILLNGILPKFASKWLFCCTMTFSKVIFRRMPCYRIWLQRELFSCATTFSRMIFCRAVNYGLFCWCHSAKCNSTWCYHTEFHSTKCHSAKCHSAECHSFECSTESHSAECRYGWVPWHIL